MITEVIQEMHHMYRTFGNMTDTMLMAEAEVCSIHGPPPPPTLLPTPSVRFDVPHFRQHDRHHVDGWGWGRIYTWSPSPSKHPTPYLSLMFGTMYWTFSNLYWYILYYPWQAMLMAEAKVWSVPFPSPPPYPLPTPNFRNDVHDYSNMIDTMLMAWADLCTVPPPFPSHKLLFFKKFYKQSIFASCFKKCGIQKMLLNYSLANIGEEEVYWAHCQLYIGLSAYNVEVWEANFFHISYAIWLKINTLNCMKFRWAIHIFRSPMINTIKHHVPMNFVSTWSQRYY